MVAKYDSVNSSSAYRQRMLDLPVSASPTSNNLNTFYYFFSSSSYTFFYCCYY